jgi:hypothetical protein
MGISNTPPISQFPLWENRDEQPLSTRYAPLPTAATLKSRDLFGIPLRSALTGQTVDDATLQDYINQAVSQLEHTLDIYITPTTFTEKHDYQRDMFAFSFAYIKLNHPNVISVSAVQISFNNATNIPAVVTFPVEHVHLMPQEGVVQLVPAYGTSLSGFLLSAFSGVQYHAFQQALLSNWPGGVRVTYTAGFEDGKIPAAISGLIGRIAAYKFLSTLGPVLFPHNSVSIGIDGVSQSSSNPGPAFLNQRLQELDRMIKEETEVVRGYYQRKFLVDFL